MFICKKTNNVIKTAGAGKQQNDFVESEEKQTTIVKYWIFFFFLSFWSCSLSQFILWPRKQLREGQGEERGSRGGTAAEGRLRAESRAALQGLEERGGLVPGDLATDGLVTPSRSHHCS